MRWTERLGWDFMSGLQPSGFVAVLTQGFALGWDMAAPLALSGCGGGNRLPWQSCQAEWATVWRGATPGRIQRFFAALRMTAS